MKHDKFALIIIILSVIIIICTFVITSIIFKYISNISTYLDELIANKAIIESVI